MRIPGFTAKLSLLRSRSNYKTLGPLETSPGDKRFLPQMMMSDGGIDSGFLDDGGAGTGGGGGGSGNPPCQSQCLAWCERPDGGIYCCHWQLCPL